MADIVYIEILTFAATVQIFPTRRINNSFEVLVTRVVFGRYFTRIAPSPNHLSMQHPDHPRGLSFPKVDFSLHSSHCELRVGRADGDCGYLGTHLERLDV